MDGEGLEERTFNLLLAAYNQLTLAIEEINPRHVLITEYPDPTHRNATDCCGCLDEQASVRPVLFVGDAPSTKCCMTDDFKVGYEHGTWGELEPKFVIGASAVLLAAVESRWMFGEVLIPLNEMIRTAALTNGWTYVGGMMDATRNNGICTNGDVRFFNTLRGSFEKQGDLHGSAHPVWAGHRALRDVLLPVLESRLGLAP